MKKLDKNFQVDVSGCTPEEIKEMAEFAAGELGCEVGDIDADEEYRYLAYDSCHNLVWVSSVIPDNDPATAYDFFRMIDDQKQESGSVLSSDEIEKQNAANKALNEVHGISKRIHDRTMEETVEFVDMDGISIEECLEVPMDIAAKMSKDKKKTDNYHVKTPAHGFLEAGVKHMKDRASERDTEGGERSMKSTVDAFNAIFADCIVNQSGKMTEEQGWHFMTLLKISRSKGGDYRQDDYEDAAAYQALAGETASVDRRKVDVVKK